MKKLLFVTLLVCGFMFKMPAQNAICTIVKTDGTVNEYGMSDNAKIYYSDSELFLYHDGETATFPLSEIRKMYFTSTTDVNEIENQQVSIYPNPAKDVLHINNTVGNQEVSIFSINGEMMMKTTISDDANIDISTLRAGIYVISTNDFVSKFIKL